MAVSTNHCLNIYKRTCSSKLARSIASAVISHILGDRTVQDGAHHFVVLVRVLAVVMTSKLMLLLWRAQLAAWSYTSIHSGSTITVCIGKGGYIVLTRCAHFGG